MQRRRFLTTLAAGGAVVLAGCSQGGADGTGDTTPTPEGGETDGGDGGTATDDSTPADGSTPTAAADEGTSGGGGLPTLGSLQVTFENNYRFSVDMSGYEDAGNVVMAGEWNGADYHSTVESDGGTFETYHVDGTTYMVGGGQCTAMPESGGAGGVDTGEWAGTSEDESTIETWGGVTATGTTTIDGEQMHVFDLSTAASVDADVDVTYYVSAATGHLRRVESQGVVMDYWDWGQVGPIQAPC